MQFSDIFRHCGALLLAALTGWGGALSAHGDDLIVINEFMASNGSVIADEDGDYEDWIELYNPGDRSVDLAGWGLSDDRDDPFQWQFSAGAIGPGGHLLIFASGKNRRDRYDGVVVNGEGLVPLQEADRWWFHTNFRINAEGERLFLVAPNGDIVDAVGPIDLPRDVSFGRASDGSPEWLYYDVPTPGAANVTSGKSEILAPPAFSSPGGFYTNPFDLHLGSPDNTAVIIYTLDGSIPDVNNLDGATYYYKNRYPINPGQSFGEYLSNSYHSHEYKHPIPMYDRSDEPDKLTRISTTRDYFVSYFPVTPVHKGIVVRAMTARPGALSSDIVTHTYFVGDTTYSLPVTTLAIQEDALFCYYDGIYVAGVDFDEWRQDNPTAPSGSFTPANYRRRGEEWESPATLEVFTPDSVGAQLRQDMGIRIHGGATRAYGFGPKSLRLYARQGYDQPEFSHTFFPEASDDGDFRRLILRNSGNDMAQTLFRDAAIQEIMGGLHFDTQAYQPSVVFINGEYWGLQNYRERYDRHYLARVHDVDPENVDILTGNASVKEGDATHFNAMVRYITDNDISVVEHYKYIQTQMDMENFLDYQIANIFARNTDWPGGNIDYWRLRTNTYDPGSQYGHDGRWQWLMYDTDHGFGQAGGAYDYTYNMLTFATATGGTSWPNPDWSTLLLRNMLKNPAFRHDFISRFADLMNTHFLPERMISIIESKKANIEAEVPAHIHRWSGPASLHIWNSHINIMKGFATNRPRYQRAHLRSFFHLPGESQVMLDVNRSTRGHIRINTIGIEEETPGVATAPYPWTGIYFQGVPITVTALPDEGYRFTHWTGTGGALATVEDPRAPSLTLSLTDDTALTAHFEPVALMHYWHFNDLPDGTITEVPADLSFLDGAATIAYPGAGAGYMDAVAGSDVNARLDQQAGQGLRARNPSDTRQLALTLPTTGYENILLGYAVHRTSNGATTQTAQYRVDPQGDWETIDTITVPFDYEWFSFDFASIPAANDNPDFAVRILFGGDSASGEAGNNRFDNITLEGLPLPGTQLPPVLTEPIPFTEGIEQTSIVIDLSDHFADPDGDALTYTARIDKPFVVEAAIAGDLLTLTPRYSGDAVVTIAASDGHNAPVETAFRMLVYPAAQALRDGAFRFDGWSAVEPEHTYPEGMLFLQSVGADPGLDAPLDYPYHIPEDSDDGYHADDLDKMGFPYALTGRSRINGLGDDGIAFINTGRDRDLGGALTAIDTTGLVETPEVQWLAGTVLRNSRLYGLRLQYRVGHHGPFADVMSDEQVVEYLAGDDGHVAPMGPVALPDGTLDQPYVQLLWRYYHVEGDSGPRAQLRLDDVVVAGITPPLPTPSPSPTPTPAPHPDADGDGKPDHCETTVTSLLRAAGSRWTHALLPDSDGDGLLDGEEDPGDCADMLTAPLAMTNPRNPDTDGDGLWDGVEVHLLGTDPLDPNDPPDGTDTSGDGLPDYFVIEMGGDPDNPDWDGNGFSNGYELLMGADPLDPDSRPSLGDVNGDGRTDNMDAIYLFNFALGNLPAPPRPENADVNGDGVIDNLDAITLFNFSLRNLPILR